MILDIRGIISDHFGYDRVIASGSVEEWAAG